MRHVLIIFILCLANLFGEYSIVFIHIGHEIPSYADTAISQARLFNPSARIILLGSQIGLKRFQQQSLDENVQLIAYETLQKSIAHKAYEARCVETSPFWRYTSERFLYLWDLIEIYSLTNVFHLENDNMLYADLEPLLSHFQHHYPGIAATFDNEERCIPGFIWVSNGDAMRPLAEYFSKKATDRLSDMYTIGNYRKEHPSKFIDTLPIIMEEYSSFFPLQSPHNHKTDRPKAYSQHSETFNGIFDGAAIGQFLGGLDPIHANNGPGFINESCLFNPSLLEYKWILDDQGRSVPHAVFNDRAYKLINLHLHCNNLRAFKS